MKNYQVRPARPADLAKIGNIIRPLSGQGRLQSRDRDDIRRHLLDFMVVARIEPPKVVACAELRILSPKRMAEIWSLGVSRSCEDRGLEIPLLKALVKKARSLELEKVYTVSDQIEVLGRAGFRLPATGEKHILFFDPQGGPFLTGGNFEIRTAQLGELAAIYSLIKEASREGSVLERSPRELEDLILQSCCFVAVKDKKIVGHVCLDIYNPDQGELRSLVVAQDFNHQGLAKGLIAIVCREAWKRRLGELITVTNKTKLFLDLGFKFSSRLLTEARWIYPLEDQRGG